MRARLALKLFASNQKQEILEVDAISDYLQESPMLREINGILRQTNLSNESEEYVLKREELRRAEIDLRKERERVAELRRQLPQGPAVEGYIFEEVSAKPDAEDT